MSQPLRSIGSLQKELLEQVLFNSFIYVVTTDMEGRYTYLNPYFCKRMSVSAQECLGRNSLDHIIPEDHQKCIEVVQRCVEHPYIPQSTTLRKPTKNGGFFYTDWQFTYIPEAQDASAKIIYIGYDSSERVDTESQFKHILDNVSDCILTLDAEGQISFASSSWTAQMGYSLAESIGQKFCAFVDEKYHDELSQILAPAAGSSADVPLIEHPIKDKKGQVHWVELKSTFNPKSGTIFLILRDITEKKEDEVFLNRKDNELQTLIETTNTIHWKIDLRSSRFTYMDEKVEQLLGYSRESWTDLEVWANRVHEDDRKFAVTYCSSATKRGEDHEFEYRAKAKDGSVVWLKDVVTVILKDGHPVELVGFMVDITKQKLAQEKLKFQAELLDLVGQAVIAIDPFGKIIYWNKMSETIYGWTKEEVIGQPIVEVTPSDQTKEEAMQIMKHMMAGKTWTGEFKVHNKAGQVFPVFVSNTPFLDKNGQLQGIVGVSYDLRQQKEAEAAKKTARDLEIRNQEMEQFAFVASHDLQQPLRSLKSFSQLLETRYASQLDEKALSYLNFISDASSRMSALVTGLLEYSRLGVNGVKTTIDLNALLKNVLLDLSSTINETKAKIEVPELPEVAGFKIELHQLFQNLLGNALKFCPPDRSPVIRISVEQKDQHFIFGVHDNGIGIPKNGQKKIFLIFSRLHHESEYKGTGIGLAHCKKIAEMHQGKIWVDSEPGKGSSFCFSIIGK